MRPVGGLVVDRFWRGPDGGPRPITVARTAGATACVVAVAVAGRGAWGGDGTPALLVLPMLAGAAVAVQSALNGRVAALAGSPWPATLINFVVAAGSLTVALTVRVWSIGHPSGRLPTEPLLSLAGVIGVGVIAIATLVVRRIGVLVFGLAGVVGQLLGAIILDLLTPGPRPSPLTYVGVAITVLALVLAARPRPARRVRGVRPDAQAAGRGQPPLDGR